MCEPVVSKQSCGRAESGRPNEGVSTPASGPTYASRICFEGGGLKQSRQAKNPMRLPLKETAIPRVFPQPVKTTRLGGTAPPVGNLFQTISERMLEQPHHMPRVFKFMNVRPNLRLPREFMRLRLAAGSTPGVQTGGGHPLARHRAGSIRQLNKDAPDLFDFLVGADQVLIPQ